MKKYIIAAALVLSTAVTALSLTKTNNQKAEEAKIKSESVSFSAKDSSMPKSDIATAD
ncbi:hypothetical protein [Mucilaginibacter segetis]|uniref:Uncharacterized protein n=1 Tax=Mucilaginibacter segetis TaxID=2793071 RepID=A0A934UP20_9SPHI|nr:hypothetical protein [Mucilaginibacter segetis]MBK0380979.1 hypothetical protein [Mucilaginibacter segetis]